MGVAYASGSRQTALKQRRPLPRRGQVKAAIAASWLHTLASIVHGARSVALSHSHSGWSFRSNWRNKRKDCDFYHLKVDAKIYKHFRSSDSNTSRADKEQEEKQLQEHRAVQALTKARAGCQSEKKIVWFLDSCLQEICGSTEDPRPRFHISQNVESGPALSKNKVGSMSGDGGGERAIAKNVDVKRIDFVNAASSNPWLSLSTVILRFLGRKCLKALSRSRSSEGGKKTPIAHCHFASLETLIWSCTAEVMEGREITRERFLLRLCCCNVAKLLESESLPNPKLFFSENTTNLLNKSFSNHKLETLMSCA